MIHRRLQIAGMDVNIFIDDGGWVDFQPIADCLNDMGATEDIIWQGYDLYERRVRNEAFTYTKRDKACIYIGRADSGKEFLNSVVHEIRHLVDYIAEYYGIKDTEKTSEISGGAALKLAEDICRLGCERCNK